MTPNTASSWGAFVTDMSGASFNVGGCIDLQLGEVALEKSSGGSGSCGDRLTAANGCISAACGPCMTPSDMNFCAMDAQANQCASYGNAIGEPGSPCNALDGGPNVCLPQTSADFTQFVAFFCGP